MPAASQGNIKVVYKKGAKEAAASLPPSTPLFVKDTSRYWYKQNISREDAIRLLKDKPPGTFIIRDSTTYPGAYGLALKVSTPPPGVHRQADGTELVRHFLIEPTKGGVKIKGCNNEPVFGSLASLVYQHSITPLALPCVLTLPDTDSDPSFVLPDNLAPAVQLLEQGAACNVTYLHSFVTESLTGPEAIRRTTDEAFSLFDQGLLQPTVAHFKVAASGITLTDQSRKLFFRRHYAVNTLNFCGLDPVDRRWMQTSTHTGIALEAKIFGFVARVSAGNRDNECHVFAELDPDQPAVAVVNFISKVMMSIGTPR